MNFETLTLKELHAYAQDTLGVTLPSKMTKAEIIIKIRSYGGDESIGPAGAGSATEGNEDKIPTAVIISLQENGDATDNFETVVLNGRNYQIRRGTEVRVPYGVYDILKRAVEVIHKPVTGDDGRITQVKVRRPRIPFSVIKMIYAE